MKSKILILLMIALLLVMGLGAQPAEAESSHPRLYFTSQEIIQLRALRTADSHKDIWNNIESWAAPLVNDLPPGEPAAGDWEGWRTTIDYMRAYIENMAFMYFMTEDTAYLNASKDWLLSLLDWSTWQPTANMRLLSITAQTTAFGYDALYDYLTPSERTALGDAMVERIGAIYEAKKDPYPAGYMDSPNTQSRLMGGLGIAGLALIDEYPVVQDWIDFAVTYGNMSLQTIGIDGAGREGWSYMASALRDLIPFLNALLRVTGQDLFTGSHLNQVPYYWVYFNYNDYGLQFEDANWREAYLYDGYRFQLAFIYLLSSKYNNPYGQWFANNYAAQYRMSSFVWKNPDLIPKPPDDLPLTRYFRDYGYVLWRNGWGENDLLFTFKSGTGLGHAHESQNEFQIYNQGQGLSFGGGYIEGDDDQTWRHNCILVDGEGQPDEGSDDGQLPPVGLGEVTLTEVKDPYYRYLLSLYYYRYLLSPYYYRYLLSPYYYKYLLRPYYYRYLLGDASAAYQGRLDKWLRHIVFVEPDYFVIYDELAASSPKQFDWLLHAPSLGGAVPNLSVNGDLITLTGARGGELKVKVVEPEGFKYEILSYGTSMGTSYYLKMHPRVDKSTAQFLTVLFPDSVLDVTKVETGNVTGVKVVDGDKLDLVLFSADGNPVNEYIELGGYYQAADGNTYTFNGTQVLASFDTYQVMRLGNPFRCLLESFLPFYGHY